MEFKFTHMFYLNKIESPSRVKSPALTIIAIIAMVIFSACSNGDAHNAQFNTEEPQEGFQALKVSGKWTTDRNTAMELRALQSTMTNFNLLIKKQPQNLDAYRAYSDLLQNHVNRTVTYCSLDQNTKSVLCKDLDKIKLQIEVIQRGDIGAARKAALQINMFFSEIDSTFNFNY